MSVRVGVAGGAAGGGVGAIAGGAEVPKPLGSLGWFTDLLGIGKKRTTAVILEDDEFLKKWSGVMLLGPIVPAVVSVFVIIIGEIVLNSKKEVCNFPLDVFIQAVIAICYLFMIIFSWIYLGDTITLHVPLIKADWTILVPFTSLKFLMRIYLVLGITSFIIMCVGGGLLTLSRLCVDTAPRLYSLTLFMVAVYFLGFIVVCILLTKLAFGSQIFNFIKEAARAPNQNEFEEKIFTKSFNEFDRDKNQTMARDDFGQLLQNIGVYIPDNEQPALLKTLDPDNTGVLQFNAVLAWFRKINSAGAEFDDGKDDDDDGGKGGKPPPVDKKSK